MEEKLNYALQWSSGFNKREWLSFCRATSHTKNRSLLLKRNREIAQAVAQAPYKNWSVSATDLSKICTIVGASKEKPDPELSQWIRCRARTVAKKIPPGEIQPVASFLRKISPGGAEAFLSSIASTRSLPAACMPIWIEAVGQTDLWKLRGSSIIPHLDGKLGQVPTNQLLKIGRALGRMRERYEYPHLFTQIEQAILSRDLEPRALIPFLEVFREAGFLPTEELRCRLKSAYHNLCPADRVKVLYAFARLNAEKKWADSATNVLLTHYLNRNHEWKRLHTNHQIRFLWTAHYYDYKDKLICQLISRCDSDPIDSYKREQLLQVMEGVGYPAPKWSRGIEPPAPQPSGWQESLFCLIERKYKGLELQQEKRIGRTYVDGFIPGIGRNRRGLVIEADGPHHRALNDQNHELGRTLLKRRMLQRKGYEVSTIQSGS